MGGLCTSGCGSVWLLSLMRVWRCVRGVDDRLRRVRLGIWVTMMWIGRVIPVRSIGVVTGRLRRSLGTRAGGGRGRGDRVADAAAVVRAGGGVV
jgi:hypothetical protein